MLRVTNTMQTVLYFCALLVYVSCQGPAIQTPQGIILGRVATNQYDASQSYYAFQGIPYARPPLGAYRFKDPAPPIPWNGILQTTVWPDSCLQWGGYGVEDCLYLNVFTPQLPSESDERLPVLVWIHGGAFITGSGAIGPDYFIPQGIIVASLNYRLGVFGFLSTLDEAAEGNAGLKDQAQALGWIHDNIGLFGGDPDRITIIGESAGSAAVQHLVHSPLTEGLFAQAIGQSGSTMNRWAFERNPWQQTVSLANYFGIPTTNTAELIRQLQELDAQDVLAAATDWQIMGGRSGLDNPYFSPSTERPHDGAFLSQSPYDALINGDFHRVPYVIGYATGDGSYAIGEDRAQYDLNHELLVPQAMNIPQGSEDSLTVGDLVYDFFYGNETIVDDLAAFIAEFGDEQFVRAIRLTIEYLKLNTTVYVYRFGYKGSSSTPNPGVAHSEDLQYFFYQSTPQNATDQLVRERCVQLWSNFVKYGNPTPEDDPLLQNIRWGSADSQGDGVTPFLAIESDLIVSTNPDEDRWEFWRLLYDAYAVLPYITY